MKVLGGNLPNDAAYSTNRGSLASLPRTPPMTMLQHPPAVVEEDTIEEGMAKGMIGEELHEPRIYRKRKSYLTFRDIMLKFIKMVSRLLECHY